MRLSRVSTYFDKEVFTGIVETGITFNGQLRVFTDETSSGSSRNRRVLSLSPSISIPTDFLISHADGEKYIIAKYGEEDYWNGSTIRKKHTVSTVTHQSLSGTIGDVLNDTLSTILYASISPLSTYTDRIESSDKKYRVRILFSSAVSLPRDTIVKYGTDYYHIITRTIIDPAGFNIVDANLLENPVTTCNFTSMGATYDPVEDEYSTTVSTGISTFQLPAVTDYDYQGMDAEKVMAGDLMVSVLKSDVTAVNSGDEVALSSASYNVVHVVDNTTYWTMLCRK